MKIIRKTMLIGLLAMMMLAAPAIATAPSIDIQMSTDGGANWESITGIVKEGVVDADYIFRAVYTDYDGSTYILSGYSDINSPSPYDTETGLINSNPFTTPTLASNTFESGETLTITATAVGAGVVEGAVGAVQEVPEPTTIAMTAIGILGVLGFVFLRRER